MRRRLIDAERFEHGARRHLVQHRPAHGAKRRRRHLKPVPLRRRHRRGGGRPAETGAYAVGAGLRRAEGGDPGRGEERKGFGRLGHQKDRHRLVGLHDRTGQVPPEPTTATTASHSGAAISASSAGW